MNGGNVKSGIRDKHGNEVKIGDTLIFPYIDPWGGLDEDKADFAAKSALS